MNIRKTLIIVVSIIILLLFGLVSSISYNAGMSYGEQNAESIRESRITDSISHEKTLKIVSVQIANNSNQNSEIKSSGRVVSLNNITISSETSGKLEGNFSIKKGVKFRKGSVLFKVKNTDMYLLLKAKKSKFMNLLSSNLADIKLDFSDEYKKWDDFFNSLSLEKTIGNLPETNSSKEKNFIISRGIMSEYLSVKSDEEKLRKYTVRAPFDGVISKSYTDISANVNMGTPVIDVIRDGKKEVELTINTSENEFIKVGSEVVLTDGTNTFVGKITRKGNFVNEKTQNISVFTEISSDTEMIYSGMYLEGTISSNITNNVCKIPRRSIFSENNIYVVNSENKLEIMSVEIISYQGSNVLVSGINNNTMVVNEPLIDVTEGIIVKPISK
ncbi:MAG: HlyD family efflux transporter periplasmic adaptor subunit [Flavobacteriales bacterium]|nr:HlyD family efflux transporter periplasmic adaptor subunit [Flavobacteriales bacterium]